MRSRNFLSAIIGMAMAGVMADLGRAHTPRTGPSPERRPQRRTFAAISSSSFPRNGARECARRRWQMYGLEADREAYLGPRRRAA